PPTGAVWAWGKNSLGQLGQGSINPEGIPSPVIVVDLTDVTVIAAGFDHALALKSDGSVWAWGDNGKGQLGNGAMPFPSSVPVKVCCLGDVVAIAAGESHSLALKRDGSVWAWGGNDLGQPGTGPR